MKPLTFSWDDRKNKANQKKHGISFEEAQSVFFDENAIEFFDPDHSEKEDRFLLLGLSYRLRILVSLSLSSEKQVRDQDHFRT